MKTFFKVLAAFVVLLILAVVAVVMVVDPNEYKPQIQAQVKQAVNRDLLLNGNIGWSIFPTLGVTTSEVYLQNPQGFNRDNLLEIKQVSVALELLPLLSGQIKIGLVTLDGFRLNMITKVNGRTNLDGMSAKSAQTESSVQPTDNETDPSGPKQLSLGGVAITNAVIEIQDLAAKTQTLATIKQLTLGEFVLGQPTELSMLIELALADQMAGTVSLDASLLVDQAISIVKLNNMKLNADFSGASLPNQAISAALNANVSYTLASGLAKLSELEFKLDQLELAGWASVVPAKTTKIRFDLVGNVWDLQPYLGDESATTADDTSTSNTNTGDAGNAEPDLSALLGLDVKGTFALAGLKASGLTLNKITSKIIVANGKAQLSPLTANLYQGQIKVTALVDHANGRNKYKVTKKISGIQILPLMKDMAQLEIVSGVTALNLTAQGAGLSPNKLKTGLVAAGEFSISDGALYGINIAQKIRSAKATLTGKSDSNQADEQKTDFSSLTGTFKINKGVFNNTRLTMLSPLLRLKGAGTANIIKETINYKLGVTVVGSLKGQGGATDDQLSGLNIPLKVTGTFAKPKFGLDTSGALKSKLDAEKKKLKQKAKDKLKEKLEGKLGDKLGDKLKGKLGSLFG